MRIIGAWIALAGLCIMLIGGMMGDSGWSIGRILLTELIGLAVLSAGAVIHNLAKENRRPCGNTDDEQLG